MTSFDFPSFLTPSPRLGAAVRALLATAAMLFLTVCLPVRGADSAAEAEIRAIHRQYDAAWANQDSAAFERLLAPDFEVIETDGRVTPRPEVIESARSGAFKVTLGESRDVRIVVHEGTAVVRGLWRGRGTSKGRPYDELSRYTTTYGKLGGQWKVLSDQTTKISAAAAVAQLHEKITKAKGEADAANLAALFTQDGWGIWPNQPIVQGRTALEQDMRSYLKKIGEEKIHTEITNLEVEEFGTWAYNLGRYKDVKADGTVVDEGTFVGIWKVEDGQWKLFRDFGTSSLPKKDK